MPARDKRQKASDVFTGSTFVHSRKGSFDEAFPDIDDVEVEVVESRLGSPTPVRVHKYTKASFPGEFVDCSKDICYNGGVSIGNVIHSARRAGKVEHSETHGCQGYEGSPKGRRRYRSCIHSFRVTVRIRYKD